ncbi:hypothetical protein MUP77_17800 [Candidatus Bathyarchaeota archaeon]|nr:hypothetical protein [Candidatus Bathyarchaeota archaeon]
MLRKFIVRGELDESKIRAILEPILQGTRRTTHKVKFKTSKGVVEYISIPLGSDPGRYSAVVASGIVRKIFLWNRKSIEELEKMLRTNGISITEIVKEDYGTLALKK